MDWKFFWRIQKGSSMAGILKSGLINDGAKLQESGSHKTDLSITVLMKWRVTHTRNLWSAFNPSKCTHTHTHSSSGQPMLRCLGSGWGSVPCSRVSPQLWYWRWREHSLFTPPHWLFLPDPRFEPTTSGYNALSIRISDMENGWMYINIL